MAIHHKYMQRCLELALRGNGNVAPNPMVGAVLVYNDRIIGEGWHRQYGEVHAEVNCINSVKDEDRQYIPGSTLYVSLEPCAHFGRTPPCADLVVQQKIPFVVIGCRDPFKEVDGKGIGKLEAAGVKVELGVMEAESRALNKRFFTFHTEQRPYVILKWAQTADGKIGSLPGEARLLISNEYTNRLVHQWRSEEAAILIGTNTALQDDPSLTTRSWPGNSPIRVVLDMDLRLPQSLRIFDRSVRTIIINAVRQEETGSLLYYKLDKRDDVIAQILTVLPRMNIQSLLVEGGAKLLQSFIDARLWDEARVIKNEQLVIRKGIEAPVLSMADKIAEQKILADKIEIYNPKHS